MSVTPQKTLKDYEYVCSKYNVQADSDRYNHGWESGLENFCSKSNGYKLARDGKEYTNNCPEEFEEKFLEGYEKGQKVYTMEQKVKALDN